jgi:hypothetical protein
MVFAPGINSGGGGPGLRQRTEDSTAAFCQSLQELAVAEANVRSIDVNTSVDQAKQYGQELQTAWNNMVSARQNLAVDKFDELQNAYNELRSTIDGLSGEQSVAQALPTIRTALTTFEANLNEIRTTVCSITPTSTPASTP